MKALQVPPVLGNSDGGGVILIALAMGVHERSTGQVATVLWQNVQHAPQRPAGNVFAWNGSQEAPVYTPTAQGLTDQSAPQSGKDWLLDHAVVTDYEGNVTGIVGVGYSNPQNWSYTNGCVVGNIGGFPNPLIEETHARRKGSIRQVVCYFNAGGVLQWFKFLGAGVAHGVIVDREGYIVVTGQGYNYDPFPETPGVVSLFNPAPGYTHPITEVPCPSADQLTLTKLNQAGDIFWSHFYNTQDDMTQASLERCQGQSLVETNAGDLMGYRIVGWQRSVDNLGFEINQRPCIVQVDANGLIQFKHRYPMIPGANLNTAANDQMRAMYISRCPLAIGERFAVTGYRNVDVPGIGARTSAWMMYMDDAIGTALDAEWTKDVFTDNAYFGADLAFNSNANRVAVTMTGTTTSVVWPVMLNYRNRGSAGAPLTNGDIFAGSGNREATARLYKFNGTGGTPTWTVNPDLGTVRAMDMFFSVKQRNTGNLVVASTKLSPGFNIDNPFDYADMAPAVQSCLTSPTGLGYDPDGTGTLLAPTPWSTTTNFNYFGHMGTDSWAAIVSHTNGSRIWDYQWDEDDGANSDDCLEDNWRQRQCNFQVTTDPQGDIIVCGNAGRNMDDFYLAKIQPSCDAKADYAEFESENPTFANNELRILNGQLLVWNDDMNVRGSIIVEAGGELRINNGATIRFADSRKMGYTCNIVVMPRTNGVNAGDLRITHGATVTSLAECPESMWDGVRLLGTGVANEGVQWQQGELYLESGGSIRNALVGATNCQVDLFDPTTAAFTNVGGIVKAQGGQFINNRYDVVMRPYASFAGADAQAESFFHNSIFRTTSALNYPDLHPETHLWMDAVSRMRIGGNTFENLHGFGANATENWGTGIFARGTTIWVFASCGTGNTWLTTCAFSNIGNQNTFRDLVFGIEYFHTLLGRQVKIRDAVMYGCGGGIRVDGAAQVCELLRNNITLRPNDFTSSGLAANFGLGVWGQPLTFTVENNLIESTSPGVLGLTSVGAIFDGTGGNPKRYYNNTFNYLEFGTFIQGNNDGPDPGDGLEIKCNDYGITPEIGPNAYDIVFNDVNPSVGDRQGSPGTQDDAPAGNRFNLSGSSSSESNMYVPLLGLPPFSYWHHAANANWLMKPIYRTDPPVLDGWFTNTQILFDKTTACPNYIPLVGNGGPEMLLMAEAQEEHALLQQVYDSERDGGDTEGLKEYVYSAAHTSSDVRSALMLHAPKVSMETWAEVFRRESPMNPWHLAQALVANSPLQPEVVRMMEESGLTTFYKDLVYGAQNGGVSSLTILESEMGYWKHAHSVALYRLATAAMDPDSDVSLDDLLASEASHPEMGQPLVRIGALIAKGELLAAKTLVDDQYASTQDPELEVLSLRLGAEIAGVSIVGLNATTINRLQELADSDGPGMFSARTWLNELGLANYPPRILLPTELRSTRPVPTATTEDAPDLLRVYPNPSDGKQPVYVVAHLLDGMTTAEVRVFDPLGRQIMAQRVNNAVGITEIPTDRLSNGLYSVVLLADGLNVGSTKFEIIR